MESKTRQRKIVCENREQWLELRRTGIGASEAAAILGACNPLYGSPLSVYVSKVEGDDSADEPSEASGWGLRLEPILAEHYALITGRQLIHSGQYTIHRDEEYDFLLATLDREIVSDPTGRFTGPGVLEIKTANQRYEHEWEDGEAPLQYLIQLMHQLRVTGYSWGSICVLLGGQRFLWCDLARDEDFIEKMVDREIDFWRHVQAEIPPPPLTGGDSEAAALTRLYPKDSGKTVDLPGEFIAVDDEIVALKEDRKKKQSRLDFLEALIVHRIGAATFGLIPNGTAYSYREQHRNSYTVKEADFRVLRRKPSTEEKAAKKAK
jgi:putative phage-type endonuclease